MEACGRLCTYEECPLLLLCAALGDAAAAGRFLLPLALG